jgi:hypothetical protein
MKGLWLAVTTGTGEALDKLGSLLDMPRTFYGPDQTRAEADAAYRMRLMDHKTVQLLLLYCDEGERE